VGNFRWLRDMGDDEVCIIYWLWDQVHYHIVKQFAAPHIFYEEWDSNLNEALRGEYERATTL